MKKMLVFLLCLLVLCLMAVPGSERGGHKCPRRIRRPFCRVHRHVRHVRSAGDKYIVYNEPQSKKRLSPCSTFKIYNSLIGLGNRRIGPGRCIHAVQMERDAILFPYWNHDHTLASATRESVVCGTSRARRAHPAGTDAGISIDKIGYGNKDISGSLTTFWLYSSSTDFRAGAGRPAQQAIFRQLPFSAANTAILQKNILFPRTAAPS